MYILFMIKCLNHTKSGCVCHDMSVMIFTVKLVCTIGLFIGITGGLGGHGRAKCLPNIFSM